MGVETAIKLMFLLIDRLGVWSKEIVAAQAEGRKVNVDIFVQQDNAEKELLEEAIAKRKAGGG